MNLEDAIKFMPLLTTPLGAWLGWWLRGLTDKRQERTRVIESIGKEYLSLLGDEGFEPREGQRLHCLQRAGALRLQKDEDLAELGRYIAAHGHIDPVANKEGWLEILPLRSLLEWASQHQVPLQDDHAVLEAMKTTVLPAIVEAQNTKPK